MSNASKDREMKPTLNMDDAAARKSNLIPRLEALEGTYFMGQDRGESNGPQQVANLDKSTKPAVADIRRNDRKVSNWVYLINFAHVSYDLPFYQVSLLPECGQVVFGILDGSL